MHKYIFFGFLVFLFSNGMHASSSERDSDSESCMLLQRPLMQKEVGISLKFAMREIAKKGMQQLKNFAKELCSGDLSETRALSLPLDVGRALEKSGIVDGFGQLLSLPIDNRKNFRQGLKKLVAKDSDKI